MNILKILRNTDDKGIRTALAKEEVKIRDRINSEEIILNYLMFEICRCSKPHYLEGVGYYSLPYFNTDRLPNTGMKQEYLILKRLFEKTLDDKKALLKELE